MFDCRTTSGSAALYLNSLLQTYMPSRSLRSASEWRITVPSQRGTKSLSLTFSLTVPIWWNDLPNSIRAAESLPIFKKRLKTHLFHLYLTSNSSTLYSNFILSNLSSFYLNKHTNIWPSINCIFILLLSFFVCILYIFFFSVFYSLSTLLDYLKNKQKKQHFFSKSSSFSLSFSPSLASM